MNRALFIIALIFTFEVTLPSFSSAMQSEGPNKKKEPAVLSVEELADLPIEELVKVQISPFEISTAQEEGYRAVNSISASRFNAPINELPFALQVFTESFIEDQKPVNIFDVAKYSPSVTYRSNDFNEGNANVALRGFAVSSTPGASQIFRDGFHGPSIFDFTNVSRMEIVKGPASFLYGQLAPGGIVNIITKTPQPEFSTTGKVRYGSYHSYRYDVDTTGPATKNLFYRVATSYDYDIQYWDQYNAHSMNISPALLWRPNERWSISLKYENFQKREHSQVMQKPAYSAQSGPVPTAEDPNLSGVEVPGLSNSWNSMSTSDFRNSNTSQITSSLNYKLNNQWDVRSGYSYLEYNVDALFTGNFGMANNTTFIQGRRVRFQNYGNRDQTFEVEALGKYKFDEMSLRLLLGGQLNSREFDQLAGQAPNNPALGNDPTPSPLPPWDLRDPSTWNRDNSPVPLSSLTESMVAQTTLYHDKAIYAGATLGFLEDRLLLLCGLRNTETDSQAMQTVAGTSGPKFTNRKLVPQYGLLYKLYDNVSVFASYAESFVPGTEMLTERNVNVRPAEPTQGQGYDVGFKADLLDGRLSGTFTAFEVSNKNIINDITELDPNTGTQVFTKVQSGIQRSRGFELDVTFQATNNWQNYFSYSYMDAKIIEFSGDDETILSRDPATLNAAEKANYRNVARFHNAPLQMSAPHLANFWTRYNFIEGSLKGYSVAGGANWVFDQALLSDTPSPYHQTYILYNAMVGYSWKWQKYPMTVDLMGKNLTDASYRPSQSTRSRPLEVMFSFTAQL
jgi:iron complex outermembrane receptor protein